MAENEEVLTDEGQANGEEGGVPPASGEGEGEGSGEGPAAGAGEEGAHEGGEQKKPGVQKRIDELTKDKYEAKREAQYWKDVAEGKIQPPKKEEEPAPAAPVIREKPKQEDFQNYDEFHEALTEYVIEQKEAKKAEEREQAEAARKTDESFKQSAVKAKERYSDFEDVVKTAKAPCTQTMFNTMLESEVGADIMYHLGKNPAEAERISRLSPTVQIKEIGRLEERISLAANTPQRVSEAPEPINPVKGTGVIVEKSLDELSPEEFAKKRREQIKQLRRNK